MNFGRRTQTLPAHRVRLLWQSFEQGLAGPRATMERRCQENVKEMDRKWKGAPTRSRPPKEEHEARKKKQTRAIQEEHFTRAREEWQKRLVDNGLEVEDWTDMTASDVQAVERALGGELEEDEVSTTESAPPFAQPPTSAPNPPAAPALSTATRTINTSASYTLVSPDAFGEDDDPLYEAVSAFTNPVSEILTQAGPDVAASTIRGQGAQGPSYSTWGPELAHPATQSVLPKNTEHFRSRSGNPYPAAQAMASDHVPAPPKRPPDIVTKPPPIIKQRIPGPSYIGPQLSDPEDSLDEEADFEEFKMYTRVEKILEFHKEAAQADIELAVSIFNMRKSKTSGREGDAYKVHEHELRMIELQQTKETERKAIVAAERQKRRAEIRRRSVPEPRGPAAASVQASTRSRLPASQPSHVKPTTAQSQTRGMPPAPLAKVQAPMPSTLHVEDVEPDDAWKSQLRQRIEDGLQNMVREAKSNLEGGQKGRPAREQARRREEYTKSMITIRTLAAEQFETELERERLERRRLATSGISEIGVRTPIWEGPTRAPRGEQGWEGVFDSRAAQESAESLDELARRLNWGVEEEEAEEGEEEENPLQQMWNDFTQTLSATQVVPDDGDDGGDSWEPFAAPDKFKQAQILPGRSTMQDLGPQVPGSFISDGAESEEDDRDYWIPPAAAPSGWKKAATGPQALDPFSKRDSEPMPVWGAPTKKVDPQVQADRFSKAKMGAEPMPIWGAPTKKAEPRVQIDLLSRAEMEPMPVWGAPTRKVAAESQIHAEPTPVLWGAPTKKVATESRVQAEPTPVWGAPTKGVATESQVQAEPTPVWGAPTKKVPATATPAQPVKPVKAPEPPPPPPVSAPAPAPVPATKKGKKALAKKKGGAPSPTKEMSEEPEPVPSPAPELPNETPEPAVEVVVPPPVPVPVKKSGWGTPTPAKSAVNQVSPASNSRPNQHPTNPEFWVPATKASLTTDGLERPSSRLLQQPPPPPKLPEFWVPPLDPREYFPNKPPHHFIQIEKSASMPTQRVSSPTTRLRRMSDPVSPSPRGFAEELPLQAASKREAAGILKNGRTAKLKASAAKRVTVEEVSDEEGSDGCKGRKQEKLPTNSRFIMEPKPGVPPVMFSRIIEYTEGGDEDDETPRSSVPPALSTAPASPPDDIPPWDGESSSAAGRQDSEWETMINGSTEAKKMKAKHVRWAPSVLANATPSPQISSFLNNEKLAAALKSFTDGTLAAKAGFPRVRVQSHGEEAGQNQMKEPISRKGKAREKLVVGLDGNDARYAMEAMEGMRMRSNPASAV